MSIYTRIDSPLGELLAVGEKTDTAPGGTALVSLSVPGQKNAPEIAPDCQRDDAAFTEIIGQLGDYFAGRSTDFNLELTDSGSPFQQRVWAALAEIEYGRTVSYGDIADRIGAARGAVRAVGTAIGANPVLVVRPCHRVIAANGGLAGYAGGLERKQQLLDLEAA